MYVKLLSLPLLLSGRDGGRDDGWKGLRYTSPSSKRPLFLQPFFILYFAPIPPHFSLYPFVSLYHADFLPSHDPSILHITQTSARFCWTEGEKWVVGGVVGVLSCSP